MRERRLSRALAAVALCIAQMHAASAATVSILVSGGPLHAVNGLSVGPDGALYGASFLGGTISKIDVRTGHVDVLVGAPMGDGDDLAIRADGVMAWTAPNGELRGLWPGQAPRVIARDLPSINPITWRADGKLFVGQIGEPDAVWAVDIDGGIAPRKVIDKAGHLNGFAFGRDGRLYAPLWERDGIVAVDTEKGTATVVASGVGFPSAVKVDADGKLISSDWMSGDIRRTDPATGRSQIIAATTPPLDNLALGADGTVYVSNPADSTVQAWNPTTRQWRDVVRGHFSAAAGMTMAQVDGRDMLLVADPLAYRMVDPRNGAVIRPPWVQDVGMSTDIAADAQYVVTSHQSRGRVLKIARLAGGIAGPAREDYKVPSATGVAILGNGDVIAADFDGGQLLRLHAGKTTVVARDLGGPMNLLRVSDTKILVSEARAGTVSEVDLATGARSVLARNLDTPEGLALLPDGRLAIAEKGRARVIAVKPGANAEPEILAADLPVSAFVFRALPDVGLPMGLAADRDGNLYVSCGGDNSIRKIALKR